MSGVLGAVLFCAVPAIECDLLEGETTTVGVIEDGATNKLTDGRKVRLSGLTGQSSTR